MRRMTQDAEEKVADLTPMLDVVFIMLIFSLLQLLLSRKLVSRLIGQILRLLSQKKLYRY